MSDEFTIFRNAPIVEAILDIRAELPEAVKLEDLAAFQDSIKERFPEKKERFLFEAGFQLSKGSVTTTPSQHKSTGYLFESLADKKVVQARLDGFSFNKLKPYENWEAFRKEGRALWNLYSETFRPIRVKRIALRYINKIGIPLPLPAKGIGTYFRTTLQIAPELPQAVANFLLRLVIPNNEIGANAIITLTIDKAAEQKVFFIFDIDVNRDAVYVERMEDLWDDFEKMRAFKNNIFLYSITDVTKELFK